MARTWTLSESWTPRNAAQLALGLGGFLGQDVTLERLTALDAAAGTTLKRFWRCSWSSSWAFICSFHDMSSGGFPTGRFNYPTPLCWPAALQRPAGSFVPYFTTFFAGAMTITICRPSIFGICSTWPSASRSALMRSSWRMPNSWCAISRPGSAGSP